MSEKQNMQGDEYHRNLGESLNTVCEQLTQILSTLKHKNQDVTENSALMTQVMTVAGYSHEVLQSVENLNLFIEQQILSLEEDLKQLEAREELLSREKDDLCARGHELNWRGNCRQLERTLADSFISREHCLSVDSARCFRDEATENLCRTGDMLRVAELRSCGLDSQLQATMKSIGQLLEKWRQERSESVDTIDKFAQRQRDRILAWLQDPRTEEQRRRGEQALNYLNLARSERHLPVQVLQSALGMNTFNASLEFDHMANVKQLQQLEELQKKLHAVLQLPGANVRASVATTDILKLVRPSNKKQQQEAGDMSEPISPPLVSGLNPEHYVMCHEGGMALHRCGKVIDLTLQHRDSSANGKQGNISPTKDSVRNKETVADDGHGGKALHKSKAKIDYRRSSKSNDNFESDGSDCEKENDYLEVFPIDLNSLLGSAVELQETSAEMTLDELNPHHGSELLAKGDTDSKLDLQVPIASSNNLENTPHGAARDPFLVRLRRRFSFTPRSESMTDAYLPDEIKVRTSGSDPAQSP